MDKETVLKALTITNTLSKITAEASRYERGVIDAETFAERVCDLLALIDKLIPQTATGR